MFSIWLGRLASLHALDFQLLCRKFDSKTAIKYADFEVEHDFSKTLLPAVNFMLDLLCLLASDGNS